MSSPMPVADGQVVHLLFDEGIGAGLGHRRRVQSLARALEALGRRCRLAESSGERALRGAALVVDSYRLSADAIPFTGGPVIAIDDLDRGLNVDLLVEPSPPLAGTPVPTSRHLSGFEYALVQRPLGAAVSMPPPSDPVVLVSLGGTDTGGAGARIAEALASSGVAAKVLHAPGPWSVAATGALVEVLPRDVALMPVLSTSSVVVCAGGVTMLESMMCGRPTLALETATNQRRAVVGATVAGAVVTSDVADPSLVASAAAELLADADRSQRLARAAQRLVDGRGADRVAVAIDELLDVQPT